jgi:hypothetical protein
MFALTIFALMLVPVPMMAPGAGVCPCAVVLPSANRPHTATSARLANRTM